VPTTGLGPKHFSAFQGQPFSYVITLCDRAHEQCPKFEHAEMMHWTFADPVGEPDVDARPRAFDDYFAGLSNRLRFLMIVDEKP
jgi:ArsR family transcriptional regulator, arsenate/arsenite/antimonite-responsive transcriptional repressor / arsenate reductase (thioredoxin)